MKIYPMLFLLSLLFTLSACHTYRYDDDYYNQLPCERDRVGAICFQNDTRKLIKMEVADTKLEIDSYTTRCVDIYEGAQDYKGKQGTKRWKGTLLVYPCEQLFIELDR